MKQTDVVIIGIILFIFAGIIIWTYNIQIPIMVYFMGVVVAIIGGVLVWYFFFRNNDDGQIATFKIMKKIVSACNSDEVSLGFSLGEAVRIGTEQYCEGIDTYYKAFKFNKVPSGGEVIVIWNCKTNDIADMDSNPGIQRLNDPFYYFDPYKGKYKIAPSEKKVTHKYEGAVPQNGTPASMKDEVDEK